jgi:hypothetical protein
MIQFKVLVPFHAYQVCLELHGQIFSSEKVAIDILTLCLTEKGIGFRIRHTRERTVFFNAQRGELASVVACPMT